MSRGGARWGAGRPGFKAIGENLQRVDVRLWARRGYLDRPMSFVWSWNRGGEPAGSVSVSVTPRESVTLTYVMTVDERKRTHTANIGLAYVPCPLGGTRPWFRCPNCGRRVGLLYLRHRRFACRHCQEVAYASQSEDELDRMWRKQSKIEARLREGWRRPKGMRQATFTRLIKAAITCEERRDEALAVFAERLLSLG